MYSMQQGDCYIRRFSDRSCILIGFLNCKLSGVNYRLGCNLLGTVSRSVELGNRERALVLIVSFGFGTFKRLASIRVGVLKDLVCRLKGSSNIATYNELIYTTQ